jgi:hypothetical protein
MAVKMSVILPEETVASLRGIAQKNGITLTAAIRQAISNEKFFGEELSGGGKLLILRPDRTLRQVIFSS